MASQPRQQTRQAKRSRYPRFRLKADTSHVLRSPKILCNLQLATASCPYHEPSAPLKHSLRPVSLFLTTPSSSSSWKRSRRQVTSTTVTNRYQKTKVPESFLKQKLASLRAEADTAIARAEAAEAKNKQLEQALLEREQEIKSKDHRLDVIEGNYEETSAKFKDAAEKYASSQLTIF